MTDGNAAAAVSTAADSFASMERMLQSMTAVKMTEKRDVLLMVRFLLNGGKKFFFIFVFKNWMLDDAVFLAQNGKKVRKK